jgi:hypothetical protein
VAVTTGRMATCEPRTLITKQSINSTAYKESSGRLCHASRSSTIWSVIFEIVSRETSVP